MDLARPALLALLVGATLLASPALLLQFQDPTECATDVTRVTDADQPTAGTFQYADLSPAAQRVFDRALASDGSVVVTGAACPSEFTYSASTERYEITKDGTRYVLTAFANDLVPEVPIAAGALAFLGLCVLGTGLAAFDRATRLPAVLGAVGLVTGLLVTASVVLDRLVFAAIGVTILVTLCTLVVAGVAVPTRRALALGGALSLLPLVALLPLAGVSAAFLAVAPVPLLLVAAGVGIGAVADRATPDRHEA